MKECPKQTNENELTAERVVFLIDNDYSQHAFIPLMHHLWAVSVGQQPEDKFYENMNIKPIFDMNEYIEHFCKQHNLTPSESFSSETQQRINVINGIVNDIKNAINQKLDLRELYKIYLRFETEAGFTLKHLEYFEK